ncbi:hypothetical protein ACTXT7_005042 [Hymenolepis weldensis]
MDLPNGGDGLVYQNSNNNSNNIQKLLPPSPPPPPIFTPTPTHYHRSKRCIQLKSKALLIVSAFLLTVIILQIAIIGLIINYHYVQNANSGSSLTMRAKLCFQHHHRKKSANADLDTMYHLLLMTK